MFRFWFLVALCVSSLAILACSGTRPPTLGPSDQGLTQCPPSPNCVSSDAVDPEHFVSPFAIIVAPDQAWLALQDVVSKWPRTTIITLRPDYMHAECKSALFRFVDDLEFELRPEEGFIAVRSASRLGESDLGVNRERVDGIRNALRERGIVE
jgi:uncharacterized protein (DUF1499 family)